MRGREGSEVIITLNPTIYYSMTVSLLLLLPSLFIFPILSLLLPSKYTGKGRERRGRESVHCNINPHNFF